MLRDGEKRPLFYRWWFRGMREGMLKHNILRFTGMSPVRSHICGNIEGTGG
jgi:hypothetical protein